MGDVLVLAEHIGGKPADATYELLGKAKELAAAFGGSAEVLLLGRPELAGSFGAADRVLTVDHPALRDYSPEAYQRVIEHVLAQRSPRLVMLANTTVGFDQWSALAVSWKAAAANNVVGLAVEGDTLVATSQILGGKIMAECELTGERALVGVAAGAFPAAAGTGAGSPETVALDPPAGLDDLKITLGQVIEPVTGDVDITSVDMLVSVGRGIGSKDNLEIVQEIADTLGVPLSASRPVIDSGWMPKSRQVGKSGQKVKPKAYLSFGISGAPEHLEGMRDAELIIACNTDANAPIFDVAHYGTTADLFDLAPALVDKLKG